MKLQLRSFIKSYLFQIVIAIIILCSSLIPISPLFNKVLGRDAGVYEYVSWRILQGDILYKDVWDHKPPITYLLNATAFIVFGYSEWAIWILVSLFVFLETFFLYKVIIRLFSSNLAFILSIFFIVSMTRLQIGNTPELYSLLFQILVIYLFLFEVPSQKALRFTAMGFFIFLCFFTKQSCSGVGAVVFLHLLFELVFKRLTIKSFFLETSYLFIGFSVPTIASIIYFYFTNSLTEFWSAAFLYNIAHSTSSIFSKLEGMISGLDLLRDINGLSIIALMGWFLSLAILISSKTRKLLDMDSPKFYRLSFLVTIGMVIEIGLTGISPFKYNHYYFTLLPVFCLSSALTFSLLFQLFKENGKLLFYLYTALLLIIISTQFSYLDVYWPFSGKHIDIAQAKTVIYITKNSKPKDYVLVLGAEAGLNYMAERRSPTRFVYQYPLTNIYYSDEQIVKEFLQDIQRLKPRLIIDAKNNIIFTNDDYKPELLYSLFDKDYFIKSCSKDMSFHNSYSWDIYVCTW